MARLRGLGVRRGDFDLRPEPRPAPKRLLPFRPAREGPTVILFVRLLEARAIDVPRPRLFVPNPVSGRALGARRLMRLAACASPRVVDGRSSPDRPVAPAASSAAAPLVWCPLRTPWRVPDLRDVAARDRWSLRCRLALLFAREAPRISSSFPFLAELGCATGVRGSPSASAPLSSSISDCS